MLAVTLHMFVGRSVCAKDTGTRLYSLCLHGPSFQGVIPSPFRDGHEVKTVFTAIVRRYLPYLLC